MDEECPTIVAQKCVDTTRFNSSGIRSRCRIHKKHFWIWNFIFIKTTLVISNKEMEDVIKIVKVLEESSELVKGVTETTENETKVKGVYFLVR